MGGEDLREKTAKKKKTRAPSRSRLKQLRKVRDRRGGDKKRRKENLSGKGTAENSPKPQENVDRLGALSQQGVPQEVLKS